MNGKLLIVIIGITGLLNAVGAARAQVAGSTTLGVVIMEMTEEVATGWSAKRSLLGKVVYNERDEKVGKVDDLIISTDKKVSYAIIGAGGFVGLGRHDVAIPFSQLKEQGGKIVLVGATKDIIKSLPTFEYASDTSSRDRFVARAEQDIAKAKSTLVDAEKRAQTLTGDEKARIDKELAIVKRDLKSADAKLAEMNKAGIKRWKQFESDIAAMTARLRKWVESAVA